MEGVKPAYCIGRKLEIKEMAIVGDFSVDVSEVIKKVMHAVCSGTDRFTYAHSIEKPLRRLMSFLNSGVDFEALKGAIDLTDLALSAAKKVAKDNTTGVVATAVKGTANLVTDKIVEFFTGKPSKPAVNYYMDLKCGNIKASLENGIQDYLEKNEAFRKLVEGKYDGSADLAASDISWVVGRLLESKDYTVDDLLTFGFNIEALIQNHSMIQVLGFLRVKDWWFNDSTMAALSTVEGL